MVTTEEQMETIINGMPVISDINNSLTLSIASLNGKRLKNVSPTAFSVIKKLLNNTSIP